MLLPCLVLGPCASRGGHRSSEMDCRWHTAGRQSQKPNSVTDLEACIDLLISKGYTSMGLVALHGASAGGLPVASVLNRCAASGR